MAKVGATTSSETAGFQKKSHVYLVDCVFSFPTILLVLVKVVTFFLASNVFVSTGGRSEFSGC